MLELKLQIDNNYKITVQTVFFQQGGARKLKRGFPSGVGTERTRKFRDMPTSGIALTSKPI